MTGIWTTVRIGGKKAEVFEPTGLVKARFGVIFLHGIGGETLAENETYTALLDKLQLVCISPHGQRCWWTDRICAEFDEKVSPERFLLDQVMPLCRERWGLAPRALGLLGISMGGQAALRLAFKYPNIFPVAAGISSAIEYHELYGDGSPIDAMYDSKEQCRQDTAPMHVPPFHPPPHVFFCIDPTDWPWHRGNDRLHEKLGALGVPHTCDLTTQAGGHSWQYFEHMAEPALKFIHAGLEQESLRLL